MMKSGKVEQVDDSLKAEVRRVRETFVLPPGTELFVKFDAALQSALPIYQPALKAFRHNVAATVSTVTMPFGLAYASVHQQHIQKLEIIELINTLPLIDDPNEGEDSKERRELQARDRARLEMESFARSEDGQKVMMSDLVSFLVNGLDHGFEAGAQELLHQGLVLLWSASEVLFRDVFEVHLNEVPGRVQELISNPKTRKRFEIEKLSLDTLVQHGFDLSTRMGTVLIAQHSFSDLPTVKSVYAVLFPNSAGLDNAFDDVELWKLYRRRHLIVHRRGVVDQSYLNSTGDTLQVGSHLTLNPQDFKTALNVVVAAGTALAQALR